MYPGLYNSLPVHLVTIAIFAMFHRNVTLHSGCVCSFHTYIFANAFLLHIYEQLRSKSWQISSLVWLWHHLVVQNDTAVKMLHALLDQTNLGGYADTKRSVQCLAKPSDVTLHGHESTALSEPQVLRQRRTAGCKSEPPLWMMHETMALDPQWCTQCLLGWA